jgi:hypothetical protein
MGRRGSRRAAELEKLRAELVKRLDQLDFRSDSLDPALAEMAQHVERTLRRLTTRDEPAAPSSSPSGDTKRWRSP